MAQIRIAQYGWARTRHAETMEEVTTGYQLPWVEIGGCRIEDVISAEFTPNEQGFTPFRLTLEVFGPVEVVYLGKDREPLPGKPLETEFAVNLGRLDRKTFNERPEEGVA